MLGRIVEDGELVACEVIHAENHVKRFTERHEHFAVGAIGETGRVRGEVAIHPQPDNVT